MAIYRNVSLDFWTDTKVENMNIQERYLFLYLLTNIHTNLCGCYEISKKQMIYETSIANDLILNELLCDLENKYEVIIYDSNTNEMFIKNWSKYNWTSSIKLHKPILKEIEKIKSIKLKELLCKIGYQYRIDTVYIAKSIGIDTTVLFCTVTDTVTVTDPVSVISLLENNGIIIYGTPEEKNTIELWTKIKQNILKEAIEEAKRKNITKINYIHGIVRNLLKKQVEDKKIEKKNLPDWFDKELENEDMTKEDQQELDDILNKLTGNNND